MVRRAPAVLGPLSRHPSARLGRAAGPPSWSRAPSAAVLEPGFSRAAALLLLGVSARDAPAVGRASPRRRSPAALLRARSHATPIGSAVGRPASQKARVAVSLVLRWPHGQTPSGMPTRPAIPDNGITPPPGIEPGSSA